MEALAKIKKNIITRLDDCVDAYATLAALYGAVARAEESIGKTLDLIAETGLFGKSEIDALRDFMDEYARKQVVVRARNLSRDSIANNFKF